MIKIAVISPENSLPFIKKGIRETDKYCVEYFIYEKLEETLDIYKKNFHKFDVFLTSGELGKTFLEGKLKKIIKPIYSLEIKREELYEILFKILKNKPDIDFSKVYIDFIDKGNKDFYFKNIFDGDEPFTSNFVIEDPDIYEKILHNHFTLHEKNRIQLSITRLSNLTEKLEKRNIPFIFLFPSEDNIKDTIEYMISEIKIAGLDDKKIVVGKIKHFDTDKNYKSILEKHIKNSIIYELGNEIEIIMIKGDFTDFTENLSGKVFSAIGTITVGWGCGDNISEARLNAEKAYEKSEAYGEEVSYFLERGKFTALKGLRKKDVRDFGIYEKLRKLNISKTLFETLLKIYEKNIWITAEELSGYIGLSRRTASRILIKLEENCLADMTLEEGVIGRPAKKYKLNF
ncbi:hypothetical protein [Fusobacterium ulcerans]|uniref:hypothetical protein n=1 Tax=Fusobacterium ulcerans TaxID=861 RepID=UPI002E779965|nr:hypothetical protein [Fusobacterium ulcerans]MEE0138117.1 hypothetical protein [Fusobacterium ulcerans]